jgi:hypothetical protein
MRKVVKHQECSENPWRVRLVRKGPVSDTDAGMPAPSLPRVRAAGASAEFRVKPVGPKRRTFCAPSMG